MAEFAIIIALTEQAIGSVSRTYGRGRLLATLLLAVLAGFPAESYRKCRISLSDFGSVRNYICFNGATYRERVTQLRTGKLLATLLLAVLAGFAAESYRKCRITLSTGNLYGRATYTHI